MKAWMLSFWKENKSLFLFIALMLVFRSAVADWNDVPTGSMKPTIIEGDRILVNRMAYDVRVPFTHISLIEFSNPQHGDIVVFDSAVSEKRLVKRVVGIPGDKVQLSHNRLIINDEPLSYSADSSTAFELDFTENLLGVEHEIRLSRGRSLMPNFGPVMVPEGFYLVLGDNRDNSADSRAIGFVPRKEILGRSDRVAFSLDYENYFLPRSDRFLKRL